MAHFAKIGLNNKVIAVHVVHNDILKDAAGVEQEDLGVQFLAGLYSWPIWKQTSYNTHGGVHQFSGTPFRKNYAGKGYTYDEDRDAFIPKKIFNSWVLNETTCRWEAPTPRPDDGKFYNWNEETTSWEEIIKNN